MGVIGGENVTIDTLVLFANTLGEAGGRADHGDVQERADDKVMGHCIRIPHLDRGGQELPHRQQLPG